MENPKPCEYIKAIEVARRLGIRQTAVPNVVAAAGIRKLVIPGAHTRYLAADVDALLVPVGGPDQKAAG